MNISKWWNQPRKIAIVVDNNSWIIQHAKKLVDWCNKNGDKAEFYSSYDEIIDKDIAFFIGCVTKAPETITDQFIRTLVVHESDLPKGKGFAPMTWQILEGKHKIPICLLEAANEIDSGRIIYRETMILEGHEIFDEWRDIQGAHTIKICQRFLNETIPPKGELQNGHDSFYKRRWPVDSKLDIDKTLREQFDLLRVVDNEKYPAFFEYRNHSYKVKIEKIE